MSKEVDHNSHVTLDTKLKKPKTRAFPFVASVPDQFYKSFTPEQHLRELSIGDSWVKRAMDVPFIQDHGREMERKLPDTWNHEIQMARIATFLAVHYGRSDEEILIVAKAGLVHDIEKLHIPLDWENVTWTPEYLEKNRTQMQSHALLGAERIRNFDPNLEIPVGLHHAFQGSDSYPNLEQFLLEHEVSDLTIPLFLAAADMTEAINTRSEKRGQTKSADEVAAILASHTYRLRDDQVVRSFSDDVINASLSTYYLITTPESQQAA